uniref:Rad60/SUMO-like domain-containing protein n=1 Tax=Sphaeramia orbicularis TaxID=375764 RepID=A0A672Y4A6_9TELE
MFIPIRKHLWCLKPEYLSSMSAGARGNVRFHFDGGKVMANQTPAQLDMEDGDIIEVWT